MLNFINPKCKKVLRIIFLFIAYISLSNTTFAQLTLGTVDSGPYTPGSTIAATFNIGDASCVRPGNVFNLRLSDEFGNFSPGKIIGSYTGFYSTYVNGEIPSGTPTGTGYKVRIESTMPVSSTAESARFEIKAGTSVEAKLTSNYLKVGDTETFGSCSSTPNKQFFLTNASTATSTVTATVKNEMSGVSTSLSFPPVNQIFTAQLAHYTIFTKAVMPDGTIATKAYFLINNNVVTAFTTFGNNIVCLPSETLKFKVSTTGGGIEENFPGDTYLINWGDDTFQEYTICDIKNSGGIVEHLYTKTSCGNVSTTSSGTVYNAFDVSIKVRNNFCGEIGTPISSYAKVVVKPINTFNPVPTGCTNKTITFINTSIEGKNPNTNSPGCTPNDVYYNWFVDGVPIKVNKPRSYDFEHIFTTNGEHIVRIESSNSGACDAEAFEEKICIQDPAKPAFSLPETTICAHGTLKVTDLSVVDNICNVANVYSWSVTPEVTYAGDTNSASTQPEFVFSKAGKYIITLNITSASCGLIASTPQTVVVNEAPTALLSPDITICNLGAYSFSSLTAGPTKALFTGTADEKADTYTWTVVPSGAGTYSFVAPSNSKSKEPSILFNDYDEYTITVVHKNNCGTQMATQKLTFVSGPTVNIGPQLPICFNQPNIQLAGFITGPINSYAWTGGDGTFYPSRNDLNAIYTPTLTERKAGQVTLTLTGTTSLPAPCNIASKDVAIIILPDISLTSAPSKSICTSKNIAYTPANNVVGSTFTWTATASANAGGFSPSGTGTINDILINTDPLTNATVTYTITPHHEGCDGTPFVFTATINPNAEANFTAPTQPICNKTEAGIILTSNLPNTKYTYTTSSTGSITGNIARPIASSVPIINDTLNNTGTTEAIVTYVVTPISENGCEGTPVTISIKVLPSATTAIAGADIVLCNASSYTLNGNNPDVGTGKWTVVTAPSTINIVDTQYNTDITGLLPGNSYVLKWTITDDAGCSNTSDTVRITINKPSEAGTITGTTTVCSGTNSGNISISGYVGNVIRWQSSPNGTNWTDIGNAGSSSITYTNLTATTHYRAVVKSEGCAEANSTESIITVNPGAIAALAGSDQALCNTTSTKLDGKDPGTNTGLWELTSGQTTVQITDPTIYNTTVTGLVPGESYTFRWTISGLAPCPASSDEVTVKIDPISIGGTTAGEATFCSSTNTGSIGLSGQTGQIIRWESSTDGTNWMAISSTANPYAYLNLTTTTQFRAVVQSGICSEAKSTPTTITVNQPSVIATVGANQNICAGNSATLVGNDAAPNSGLWTIVSGQTDVNIATPTSSTTVVTGLVPGQNYTFRWTINGFTSCPPSFAETTVNYYPTLINNISATAIPVCNGQNTSILGNIPTGGTGIYTYQWQSSEDGITFTDIPAETGTDLGVHVVSTLYYRRMVNSSICASYSNIVQITALPAIANNNITASQAICVGDTPAPITGSLPTGGDGNYNYQWQSSLDGDTWVNIPSETNINLILPIPAATILYRRIVTSATCTGAFQNISNAVTVTLNPHALAEFTFTSDKACAPFEIKASNVIAIPHPDRNSTYTWYANNVAIGTGVNFPGYTIVADNQIVEIKLVATSSLNCNASEMKHNFSTPQKIVASYTQSVTGGCSPLAVSFSNTTNSLADASYTWNFGNGTTSTQATPPIITFLSRTDGRDTTYTITLKAISACETTTATSTVFVPGAATSVFAPDKTLACTGTVITFNNFSPGNTNTYKYDFDDGTVTTPTTDKSPVTHQFNTAVVKDYKVKLTVENNCGTSTTSHIIRIFPDNITPIFLVDGDNTEGCAPLKVNFKNLTQGASTFVYDFGDTGGYVSNGGANETISHTFTTPGTYKVILKASNSCFVAPDKEIIIKVYAQPIMGFSADKTIGCDGVVINFKNTTTGAISYVWDFGDGSPTSDLFEPTHTYAGSGSSYHVTLKAKNLSGCENSLTIANYINIAMPPKAAFIVNPGNEISIPDYTFNFKDTSIGVAGSWEWDFGDGATSTLQNPKHTYNDVGKYTVTLKVLNENGCPNITSQVVSIIGIPGFLNLPNSFMPGSSKNELRTFKAKGTGIDQWRMSVFNKWGQVMWETTLLDQTAPAEGWDGTFNGIEQPQGVYYWKIDVKYLNGGSWKGMSYDGSAPKKTGVIYLIR